MTSILTEEPASPETCGSQGSCFVLLNRPSDPSLSSFIAKCRRDRTAEQQLGRSRMACGCSSQCSRAHEVQPLKSRCLQTVPGNGRSCHGERPGPRSQERPERAAAREACAQQPGASAAESKVDQQAPRK
uniref:Uncharacterized protein n=1 Tax=Rangifer tarandus platyrhynchus TaxID=3082113 RepID=A0ACB0ER51_RANTA|nr:unnamed protein product [Rangifer tarandus platyrhynchus]